MSPAIAQIPARRRGGQRGTGTPKLQLTHYPPDCTIRLVLDNHSSHISKETRAYLATRPNRFKYVLTPTHGSWLNIVETLFGKMTRTFLRQIRVGSRKELKERILLGIAEINQMPVVHRWKAFEALKATTEGV
jgi:transposase